MSLIDRATGLPIEGERVPVLTEDRVREIVREELQDMSDAFSPEKIGALPLGQVRIAHGFPNRNDQTLCIMVDGKPVARLPVTECAFEQNYAEGFGFLRLKLIAGDCLITSRPRIARHD